jgi:hypothetical protein
MESESHLQQKTDHESNEADVPTNKKGRDTFLMMADLKLPEVREQANAMSCD